MQNSAMDSRLQCMVVSQDFKKLIEELERNERVVRQRYTLPLLLRGFAYANSVARKYFELDNGHKDGGTSFIWAMVAAAATAVAAAMFLACVVALCYGICEVIQHFWSDSCFRAYDSAENKVRIKLNRWVHILTNG